MALSGTYAFNLDILDIIEEAYERCNLDVASGYGLKSAKRSIDLMLLSWANEDVNLWEIDQDTKALVDGTSSYTIESKYLDILDAVVRNTSGTDYPTTRITLSEYLSYPNKTTEGTPTHYAVERNSTGGHTVYFYPTPNAAYTLVFWGLRYIQDAGNYTNNVDIPRRFLPAFCAGLTYQIASKNPPKYAVGQDGRQIQIGGVDLNTRALLKQEYLELFNKAKLEDRDRASVYILPKAR